MVDDRGRPKTGEPFRGRLSVFPTVRLSLIAVLFSVASLGAQVADTNAPNVHAVRFSVPLSQVEAWEGAVQRVAQRAAGSHMAWRMYQLTLSDYLLFTSATSAGDASVVNEFVGAPKRPADTLFAPLREVRYDVTEHVVWQPVPAWSTRLDVDPSVYPSLTFQRYRMKPEMPGAADSLFTEHANLMRLLGDSRPIEGFLERDRRQDVMLVAFGADNGTEPVVHEDLYERLRALTRDLARAVVAHDTEHGRLVPELSLRRTR